MWEKTHINAGRVHKTPKTRTQELLGDSAPWFLTLGNCNDCKTASDAGLSLVIAADEDMWFQRISKPFPLSFASANQLFSLLLSSHPVH